MSATLLGRKVRGCLYGGAIGDALGAPAEWQTPAAILARYGEITGFNEPWDGPANPGKGNGCYTDDTHMVRLLGQIYLEQQDHLDPFVFARRIVPLIADEPRWIPEWGREAPVIDRLFYPEKYLFMRLRLANADPRLGGVGNMVNCGAAMYAAPVGLVNAADPRSAYREAVEIFAAHQVSYGLEAAGVMAACVAEACRPGASVESVVDVALGVAREGTQTALRAVIDHARAFSDWRDAIGPLRDTMRPFDGSAEDGKGDRGNGTDDWQPSRLKSIEELPIALAFLVITGGDFRQSTLAAANYGRDNDSTAGIAGAIAGALHGDGVIPDEWITQVNEANRMDLTPLAEGLTALTVELQERQFAAAEARQAAFARLTAGAVTA